AASAGLERLLRAPHGILGRLRPDHEAAIERHARLCERRRIRNTTRIDRGDEAIAFGCARERSGKETHFADAHALMQHFRERAHGPAASGELAVERSMACRDGGMDGLPAFV